MATALLSHPACPGHRMGAGHPECPERVSVIYDRLVAQGLAEHLRHESAPAATTAELERAHTPRHVAGIFARAPRQGQVALDPDTWMGPGSLEAALRAAGAVRRATDLVLGGQVQTAFCNVRPPGHHATRDAAMGFCLFNNVAVGAAHALAAGLQRVAILDFDVHHGNGTEDIFRGEARVLLCSTYQSPFYPYTNSPSVPGQLVNCPLPAGAGSAEFRAAVTGQWLPALEAFRPELVFVSAGFDAHGADPLASLRLTDEDYAWVTGQIVALARRHAGGRIVSTLEGGYDLETLARCATLHVGGLMAS